MRSQNAAELLPAELLEALRKSGCCLSVLEDMLMDDDVIYDK